MWHFHKSKWPQKCMLVASNKSNERFEQKASKRDLEIHPNTKIIRECFHTEVSRILTTFQYLEMYGASREFEQQIHGLYFSL
jgi:ribosomal protein S10